MNTVKNFFSYFFRSIPNTDFNYYIPLSILVILLIVGSLVFSFVYRKKKKTDFVFKKLFKDLSKRLIIIAVLLVFYALVRYENLPYFSMRIWLYIIIGVLLFFAYKYIKTYKFIYPKEKINFELSHSRKKTINPYIPNKRK